MSAPHIVHVLPGLGIGGTENGVMNLIGALRGDFRHTVISMTGAAAATRRLPPDTAVHCVRKRPGLDLSAVLRLAGLLRRLAPLVVHSRNWGALDAVFAARLAGVPIVIHGEHGREAADPQGLQPRRNFVRRLAQPLVDRFVTVSFDLQRWLIDTVRIPASKVLTIHNGVDLSRFSDDDREAGRRALGVAEGKVVIGTVGRLDPVKDQLGLIEAVAALEDRSAILVIVGDGPCRSSLEARAQSSDVTGRVRLLGERDDVPGLLRGFDVFVLPSLAEGISNTILEAMASGLPIVATRAGGSPELVQDGVTGTLVPVADRPALTAALATYVSDGHRRALHGKAGRQRAVEEFGLQRMVGRYVALYAALVRQKAA